ncbi:MarR family transcriptional regulator [Streptomyces somaliensis DSM 40738]|uniref:MarR family transcriptional regulator n=1 Tax=Streptomyces somaliensis (strain ATCC 33201 / DSM 40738 / JCM 12659 / KCTC 9044 / NCTC 11332 / NRRL B-12077 / IP 733) TaxID=1134445 RepID=A0AA44IE60_STRE0|nr:MarR family transcriptional regulator [Streptomyces somaliensis]MCQ0025027.1 MarR family transcriptional regulator [Streptomyces somaliensis DSM 40738]NKY15430.1 MarR family transcriptional regulator [Streptomyces somaliensis DSM 40738]
MRDSVDGFLDQWAALRDDLDLEAMGAVGRILRLSRIVGAGLRDYFAEHGMEVWEFDVLATLRRSDRPLTAKELAAGVMIGSAALTNRVDRLVARGFVARQAVPGDRRSLHIVLTDEGRVRVDEVVAGHVWNQRKLVSGLSPEECGQFNSLLRTLLVSLGDSR